MRRHHRYSTGYAAWRKIANVLGRTPLAVMARWQVLKVVAAHQKESA